MRFARPRPRPRRRLSALAAVLTLALGVAACGGGDDGASGDGSGPVTVRVGVIPIMDVAPLYLGREQGFFAEEGITVEPQEFAGGAEILPAVQSGDLQFGFSNTASLLIGASKGLPVRMVAQGVQEAADEENSWSHIWVRADSGIKTPKDLEGKRLSVNTLRNVPEVTARASLEKHGVDLSKIQFVEVPFPEANAALEQGQVDAIYVVEPFDTVARQSGARPLVAPLYETEPSLTVASYFTTQAYIEENPEVVERFVRAMNKSLEYAAQNPEAVRKTLGEYTKIPDNLLGEVRLGQWSTDLNRESIQRMHDLSKKYGLLEGEANLDELIWTSNGS
ncbi:NitT/TauT family transport system substrate-binding protein [Saccharomonospora amisosensis]|uniref:NitT/TauT family transport system substrate-binding protein n=1 Tax=Saccharomonospora amisosensis TaxID=1128677 RepID=A0A7X5ZQX6_9PSEU|nr:ABC transporter substrate-binding protein [Saccharomonospora amisosensis]NIJ12309.1 NitT/TauT family transport system substrate-binding protein [Saccharomonospora amisosensis]